MTDLTPGGTGHCLCGTVRFRYEGDLITVGECSDPRIKCLRACCHWMGISCVRPVLRGARQACKNVIGSQAVGSFLS